MPGQERRQRHPESAAAARAASRRCQRSASPSCSGAPGPLQGPAWQKKMFSVSAGCGSPAELHCVLSYLQPVPQLSKSHVIGWAEGLYTLFQGRADSLLKESAAHTDRCNYNPEPAGWDAS